MLKEEMLSVASITYFPYFNIYAYRLCAAAAAAVVVVDRDQDFSHVWRRSRIETDISGYQFNPALKRRFVTLGFSEENRPLEF